MPASTRQRTVRQPARSSNLKAKTCRQATNDMRPLTDKEVMPSETGSKSGLASWLLTSSSQVQVNPCSNTRASSSKQASYVQEVGGPNSAAAESLGTCVSTATAHKRNTTTGRSVRKARHRGPHGSSSRHRGVTQHKSVPVLHFSA